MAGQNDDILTLKTTFDVSDVKKQAQVLRKAVEDSLKSIDTSKMSKGMSANTKVMQMHLKDLAKASEELEAHLESLEKKGTQTPSTPFWAKTIEEVQQARAEVEALKASLQETPDMDVPTERYAELQEHLKEINTLIADPTQSDYYKELASELDRVNYTLDHFDESDKVQEVYEELEKYQHVLNADESALASLQKRIASGEMVDTGQVAEYQERIAETRAKVEEITNGIEAMKEAIIEYGIVVADTMDGASQEFAEQREQILADLDAERQAYIQNQEDIVALRETDLERKTEQGLVYGTDAEAQAEIDATKEKLEELNNEMREYIEMQQDQASGGHADGSGETVMSDKAVQAFKGVLDVTRQLPGAAGEAASTVGEMASGFAGASSVAAGLAGVIGMVVVVAIKALVKAIQQARKEVDEFFKKLTQQLIKGLQVAARGLATLAKGFLSLGTSISVGLLRIIKLLYDRVLSLKSLVTSHLEDMAKLNGGVNAVNKALSNLTSSLEYLKGAFTAAFVPILTFVEPTLTRIIDKLAELVNMIGMVIAKLTGATTFQKAIKQQKDYAKSLSSTNKELAEYDKLQVINKNGSGSSVGFDTVDLESTKLPEWLENLYELGKKVGTELTKFLSNIPWSKIQDGAKSAAQGISDFVNGLLSVDGLGIQVGRTIGQVLNTFITFVNGLLTGIHFDELGKQIRGILDGFLKSTDFGALGDVFANALDALTTTIINVFSEPGLGKLLAEKMTDLLTPALDIDWGKVKEACVAVVTTLVDFLNGMIIPENFALIGKTIGNIFNTLFTTIGTFAEKAEWKQWGESLKTGFMNMVETIDASEAGKAISDLITGLLDMIGEAVNSLTDEDWKEIGDKLVEFIANIDWEGIGDRAVEISEHLRKGFNQIWKQLKESGVIDDVFDMLEGILAEKQLWEKLITRIKNKISWKWFWTKVFASDDADMKDLVEWWDDFVAWWDTHIGAWWNEHVAPWFTHEKWAEIGENAKQALDEKTTALKESLTLKWTEIKTAVSTKTTELKNDLSTKWSEIKTTLTTKVSEISTTLQTKWGEMKTNIQTKTADLKANLTTNFANLKSTLSEKFDGIKTKFIATWVAIKEGIKSPINSILGFVEGMVNKIIDGLNSAIDKINSFSFTIPKWVPVWGGNSWSTNISKLDSISIPRLAEGAVIPPNKEFAAILGDQKSGVNIETPLDTMVQAFKQAIAESGGSHEPVILQLNGKTVAQAVWDEEKKKYKQTGGVAYT